MHFYVQQQMNFVLMEILLIWGETLRENYQNIWRKIQILEEFRLLDIH